jgi:hypothetical protein
MGGGGTKNVTSTSEFQIPPFLQSALRQATSAALGNFRHGAGDQGIFTSLDQQFNRASDLTRTRLSSEFAGMGRNPEAAAPARSDELQTLASNIFSPQNMLQFDPTQLLIDRLSQLIPNAGGKTTSTQPVFKTGLF